MRMLQLVKLNVLAILCLSCYCTYSEQANETNAPSEANSIISMPSTNISSVNDKTITKNIKSTVSKSTVLSKHPVIISTNQGIVTLSGSVDSDSEASRLVEISQSVVGVKDINAKGLKIKKSKQPFTDLVITAKIKGLFVREDIFGTRDIASINISVETKNGIVYLTGVIDNPEQLENVKKIISSVEGVKAVKDMLHKS